MKLGKVALHSSPTLQTVRNFDVVALHQPRLPEKGKLKLLIVTELKSLEDSAWKKK